MRSVPGSEPPARAVEAARPQGAARTPSLPPELPALGEATRRSAVSDVEARVRAALMELRDVLVRVQAEPDLFVRHLGARQLAQQVAVQELDVTSLTRAAEQDFGRALLRDIKAFEGQTAQLLLPDVRAELELLLRHEQQLHTRAEAVAQRDVALRRDLVLAEELKQASAALVHEAARVARLAPAERIAAARPWGRGLLLLGTCIFAGLLVVLALADTRGAPPSPPAWSWGATALGVGAGAWLAFGAARRRAFILARLERLRARHSALDAQAQESRAALERALALFARIDAECRADDEAVARVLARHPGAERYRATRR